MHAAFGLHVAVGVGTSHQKAHALQAGFVAGLAVQYLDLETIVLAIASVHAEEHVCPVARFGAARAGMQCEKGVAGVELAAQERLQAQLLVGGVSLLQQTSQLVQGMVARHSLGFGPGQFQHHTRVLDLARKFVVRLDERALGVGAVDYFARGIRVVPESVGGGAGFEFLQYDTTGVDVKDNLASLPVLRATGRGDPVLLQS